jgi:hypothetical protein
MSRKKFTIIHSELQVYKSLWLGGSHLSTPNAAIGSLKFGRIVASPLSSCEYPSLLAPTGLHAP